MPYQLGGLLLHDPGEEELDQDLGNDALLDLFFQEGHLVGSDVHPLQELLDGTLLDVEVDLHLADSEPLLLVLIEQLGDVPQARAEAKVVGDHDRGIQRLEVEDEHGATN